MAMQRFRGLAIHFSIYLSSYLQIYLHINDWSDCQTSLIKSGPSAAVTTNHSGASAIFLRKSHTVYNMIFFLIR